MQDALSGVCNAIEEWAKEVGKPKMWDKVSRPPEGLEETLEVRAPLQLRICNSGESHL